MTDLLGNFLADFHRHVLILLLTHLVGYFAAGSEWLKLAVLYGHFGAAVVWNQLTNFVGDRCADSFDIIAPLDRHLSAGGVVFHPDLFRKKMFKVPIYGFMVHFTLLFPSPTQW